MHQAAFDFVRRVVQALPPLRRVAEFGSRNVNGTIREIFTDATMYVGIDPVSGPNVDVVMDAADWQGSMFDAVVCCEVFEHCPHFRRLCESAFRALRPGGVFIVTAAGPGREEHSAEGDGPPKPGEYYHNVGYMMLVGVLEAAGFTALVDYMPNPGDVYALGLKAR